MIYVDRRQPSEPAALRTALADRARSEVRRLIGSASKELLAQSRVKFEPRVWIGAKPALVTLFYGKCAYCESDCSAVSSGDIEHFRPKMLGGAEGAERHLYYAWLAYDWNNLLLACRDCNRAKRDQFPVAATRARLLSSVSACRSQEQGTLLDPCHDDPSVHLLFTPSGECTALTDRGALTIGVLRLNRPALTRARGSVIDQIFALLEVVTQSKAAALDRSVAAMIVAATRASAPYAAAVRDVLVKRIEDRLADPRLAITAHKPLTRLRQELQKEDWYKPLRNAARAPAKTPMPRAIEVDAESFEGRRTLPPQALARLSRIEIRNFKAIEELAFDIPRPPEEAGDQSGALVLLGENAAGKSSVLEAVALALLGSRQIGKLGLDGKRFIRRGPSWQALDRVAKVSLYFDGAAEPAVTLTIHPRSGEFKGSTEPQVVLLGYGPRRYFADAGTQKRNAQAFARLSTLFDATATLPNPTQWLLQCPQVDFDAAIRALRQVLLLPDDTVVERRAGADGQGGELWITLHGIPTPIDRLSDGYRTVVATVVDVMREMLAFWPDLEQAQGVVLIDELDTHLHPRWKMRILNRLRMAMQRVQFIATTHDPLCLRGAYDGEVQVLQRNAEGQIERLLDLPNVQGLSVEQLLMSDFFGLMSTEDPAVERDFIRYAALAAKTKRSADEERDLEALREATRQRMKLGRSPQSQLLYESAGEYVRRQALARPAVRGALAADALKKMTQAWAATAPAKKRR